MRKLTAILAQLNESRARLFAAADVVPTRQWRASPGQEAWSTAEVIAHLMMVEQRITASANNLLREPPRSVPIWRRVHLPLRAAEWRAIRRKSPVPLNPNLLGEKEVMLAALREVRSQTIAFLDALPNRDLGVYRWPHPFFGSLNFYDWFRVVAYHEIRHSKQIREIVELLPN